jgi:CBS domain-containing protein
MPWRPFDEFTMKGQAIASTLEVASAESRMSGVYDLVKDRKTYSVTVEQTVLEAARLMTEHNIGALAVLRDGELAGILSERDIVKRVVALGRSPGTTKVSEVMTAKPRVVAPDESVEECLYIMREFGFRHLPICEGRQLKGLVSIRDIFFNSRGRRGALAS